MFPVMKESTKEKYYQEAEGMGIHPRFMYSILDLRDIMIKNESGGFEKMELIRLKDPWANSAEWKGACSDLDTDFWTEENMSKFNARNKEDENDDIRDY
jgi:hypothetical protein